MEITKETRQKITRDMFLYIVLIVANIFSATFYTKCETNYSYAKLAVSVVTIIAVLYLILRLQTDIRNTEERLARNAEKNTEESTALSKIKPSAFTGLATETPIVFVHGLFGYGPDEGVDTNYWGDVIYTLRNNYNVLEASVGPLSSFHDRACELYAQIRGKRVDYGEAHSIENKHDRYGKDFTGRGLFPDWSESNKLHFVGHSAGANTIRMMQYLMAVDYWGEGTNDRWVLSVNSLAGVLNGTPLTYWLGIVNGTTGVVDDGSFIDYTIGTLIFLGDLFSGFRNIDLDLEHFGIYGVSGMQTNGGNFVNGRDNLAYDLSMHGAVTFNKKVPASYPNTYYFSYIASQTEPVVKYPWWPFGWGKYTVHEADDYMFFPMKTTANWMGNVKLENYIDESGTNFRTKYNLNNYDWQESDGAVPCISQKYPFLGYSSPTLNAAITSTGWYQYGRWYHDKIQKFANNRTFDHLDIVSGSAYNVDTELNLDLNLLNPQDVVDTNVDKEIFYFNMLNRLAQLS